jgi:hypothetical protein
VKTENRSTCAAVNCKLCESAIALYLTVIKIDCNRSANKSNPPNWTPSRVNKTFPMKKFDTIYPTLNFILLMLFESQR